MGLTFFDLFAGVGGFRLGMERAGHTCIGSCEWDNNARETYKKNFGSYPKYDDAKDLQPSTLPQFDVLCAGFPCQAFSIAGKRLGFEDTRGTVFFEIARIAKEKKPRYLLLENVKGLLSHDKGRTFRTILSTLDEMGYDAEWQLLNSKYFVPQNRERIFIVGHLRGERTRQIFPVGEYGEETDAKIKRVGGYSQCSAVYQTDGLSPTISACTHGYAIGNIIEPQLKQIGTVGDSQAQRVYDSDGISCTLKAEGGGQGAKTGLYALTERRSDKAKQIRKEMRKKGKDWCPRREKELVPRNDNLSNCITTGQSNERYLSDGVRIRRLTPVECERLQGFPDNWTQGVSDTQRYKQMGNAVTVPVVEYLARRLE